MFAHTPIRHKLILMLLLLLVFMTAGSLAGLWGVNTYRNTVKGISNRAKELPHGKTLMRWVTNLRVNIKEIETTLELSDKYGSLTLINVENIQKNLREQFDSELTNVSNTLASYKSQMEKSDRATNGQMASSPEEQQTVNELHVLLKKIQRQTTAFTTQVIDMANQWDIQRQRIQRLEKDKSNLEDQLKEAKKLIEQLQST